MREHFPALSRFTYLNAASSSPVPTVVAQAAQSQWNDSVQSADLGYERWLEQKERLRARLAGFIGARPTEVAFTASTSMAFAAVAELLWRRGVREVLTLDAEFPSTTVPLLARGLKLIVLKARADGTYRIEDMEGAQAVAVSAVQYASGFTIDVQALARLCQERRVPLAVNVAQALGQVPVSADGVDFMCGTSHKWMMGGYGTGMLYVREGWLSEHGLPWAGWFSPPESERWKNFPQSAWQGALAHGAALRTEASALEAGGGNYAGFYALEAGLSLIESVGAGRIHAHNLGLQKILREGLQRRGFEPNAPLMSGICVVHVEGEPEAAVKALLAHGLVVSARGGGLRFSTHIFNHEQDVERALAALDQAGVRPRR